MTWRLGRFGACLFAVLLLVSCGPSEADQRQAFIGFLQTEVMPQPGVRLPKLDGEKAKNVGDYTRHCAVITDFHTVMNDSVARPMQDAMSRGTPRSIEEIVARRSDIAALRVGLTRMREALDRAEVSANEKRAALPAPADLAPVYAAVYDKLVVKPAAAFRETFPAADDAMGSILALADLIGANRSSIKLTGSSIEIKHAGLRAKAEAAMAAMASKGAAVNAAQDKMRQVMTGR